MLFLQASKGCALWNVFKLRRRLWSSLFDPFSFNIIARKRERGNKSSRILLTIRDDTKVHGLGIASESETIVFICILFGLITITTNCPSTQSQRLISFPHDSPGPSSYSPFLSLDRASGMLYSCASRLEGALETFYWAPFSIHQRGHHSPSFPSPLTLWSLSCIETV